MKQLYIIVDCSGSIVMDDTLMAGQINDIVHDLVEAARDSASRIRVIRYQDEAELYWDSAIDSFFYDIGEDRFGGRSNLGKAYELIRSQLDGEGGYIEDCVIALVSDGEASDNYKRQLALLDGDRRAIRTAITLTSEKSATEKHASGDLYAFTRGNADKENFIECTVNALE